VAERVVAESMIRGLHAARVGGDLAACAGCLRTKAGLKSSAPARQAHRDTNERHCGISSLARHDGQSVSAHRLHPIVAGGRVAAGHRALARDIYSKVTRRHRSYGARSISWN